MGLGDAGDGGGNDGGGGGGGGDYNGQWISL